MRRSLTFSLRRAPGSSHWPLRTHVARVERCSPSAPHHSRRDTPPPRLSAHAPPSPLSSAGSNPERASSGVADAPGAPSGSSATSSANASAAAPSAAPSEKARRHRERMPRCVPTPSRSTTSLSPAPGATPPGLRAAAAPASTSSTPSSPPPEARAGCRRCRDEGRSAGVREDEAGRASRSRGARRHPEGLISRGHVRRVVMTPSSHSVRPPPRPRGACDVARPLETLAPKTTLPSREKEPSARTRFLVRWLRSVPSRSIFLNGRASLTGAPRVGDASLRSSRTMTASTIAVRPARASDVAAIESFVERYALVGRTVRFLDSADRPAPRADASTNAHALTSLPPSLRPTPAGPPRVACTARSTSAASWSAPPSQSSRRREAPWSLSSP